MSGGLMRLFSLLEGLRSELLVSKSLWTGIEIPLLGLFLPSMSISAMEKVLESFCWRLFLLSLAFFREFLAELVGKTLAAKGLLGKAFLICPPKLSDLFLMAWFFLKAVAPGWLACREITASWLGILLTNACCGGGLTPFSCFFRR